MKKTKLILTIAVIAGASMLLENCSKDSAMNPLKVVSVTTDSGINLNDAQPSTGIPLNASVVVVFNRDVDASTANSSSIAILSNGVAVPSTTTVSGASVTLKPNADLPTGTDQTVSIKSTLKANDGVTATASEFAFKTFGPPTVVPPQESSQLSYFSFSGNVNDMVGAHTPSPADIRDLTFAKDRFGFTGLAGDFNGSTSIVEIPNGEQYMKNNSLTLSVWIKASSSKAGQFVLGLGAWKGFYLELPTDWSWIKFTNSYAEAGNLSESEDNWFTGTGETNQNTGWQGWTFQKDVQPHGGGVGTTYFIDKWASVVCTYDAATKLATMYINGEMVKQHDFNLWPVGDAKRSVTGVKFTGNLLSGGNKLALGFIQGSGNRVVTESWADPADIYSNHFKGQMDDLRIFKVALTAAEVATLYTAEKVSPL